jgi:hypothetical protein
MAGLEPGVGLGPRMGLGGQDVLSLVVAVDAELAMVFAEEMLLLLLVPLVVLSCLKPFRSDRPRRREWE